MVYCSDSAEFEWGSHEQSLTRSVCRYCPCNKTYIIGELYRLRNCEPGTCMRGFEKLDLPKKGGSGGCVCSVKGSEWAFLHSSLVVFVTEVVWFHLLCTHRSFIWYPGDVGALQVSWKPWQSCWRQRDKPRFSGLSDIKKLTNIFVEKKNCFWSQCVSISWEYIHV